MKNSFALVIAKKGIINKAVSRKIEINLRNSLPYKIKGKPFLFSSLDKRVFLAVCEQPWLSKPESSFYSDKTGATLLKGYIVDNNKDIFFNKKKLKDLHRICKNESPTFLKDEFDGEYVLIHVSDNKVFGFSTYSCARSFFFTDIKTTFIASDRLGAISQSLPLLNCSKEFSLFSFAHLSASVDGPQYNLTPYKHIKKFPSDSLFYDSNGQFQIINSGHYLSLIKELREKFKKNRRAFYNYISDYFCEYTKLVIQSFYSFGLPIELRLTSGMDSRLLLGAVIKSGQIDKIRVRTAGYAQDVDRIVSKLIAEKYAIPFINKKPYSIPDYECFLRGLNHSIFFYEGMAIPDRPDVVIKPFKADVQLSAVDAGLRTSFPLMKTKQDVLNYFDYAHLPYGDYHRTFGRHSSRSLYFLYFGFYIQPPLSKIITAASIAVGSEERKHARIHYELMARYDKKLLTIPFFDTGWSKKSLMPDSLVKIKKRITPVYSPINPYYGRDFVLQKIRNESTKLYLNKNKKFSIFDEIFTRVFLKSYLNAKPISATLEYTLLLLAKIENIGLPSYLKSPSGQDSSTKRRNNYYNEAKAINKFQENSIINLLNFYEKAFSDVLLNNDVREGLDRKVVRLDLLKKELIKFFLDSCHVVLSKIKKKA